MAEILVVDDTQDTLTVIGAALEGFGYAVTSTSDPIYGFQLAQGRAFDLIIVDLRMPVMDGVSFAEMLRAHETKEGRKPAPLLALTGDKRSKIRTILMKAGASGFMEKPFDLAELRETINGLIAASPQIEKAL